MRVISHFLFRTTKVSRRFCNRVVRKLVLNFNISKEEAIDRVNSFWGHLEEIGDDSIIYHETSDYWSKTIYYGPDYWWTKIEVPQPYEKVDRKLGQDR